MGEANMIERVEAIRARIAQGSDMCYHGSLWDDMETLLASYDAMASRLAAAEQRVRDLEGKEAPDAGR